MKTPSLAISIATVLSFAFAMASCSSAESDWNKASSENTVAAYQKFLAAHPKDPHESDAQAKLLQLQEESGWAEAKNTGTAAAYELYLQQYPQGAHAQEARDAASSIDRVAAWKVAQGGGTAASFQAFLGKFPTGLEADQAKAKLKDLTGYKAHLASETSDAKAQRKLTQLQARFPNQLHDLVVISGASGKSFSVDSAGMTEQEAKSVCDAVKPKHQSCEVVQE